MAIYSQEEIMKAIIYARYSSDNQREESIEGQIRECMEFAERNGITVFGTYIDRALSAKTDNRPEFQRMIKDSYRKLFDTVLVWKLDRFARNRYDSAYYKNILKKNGVKVVSAKENISDGPEGVLLESMLEGWAEYYSVDLSEKIGRGLTENALKGKMNGGGLTFGYRMKDQRLEIDETTAPVVVEIFTRYADGEKMTDIAKDLTRRGIRTSQGNKITLNVVHYLLKNRRYIGEYKFRDMIIPNAIPPIVSEELFNRVQEIMARNQKAPAMRKAEDDYILTTKLFCGKCGTFMVGESGRSHTGTVHRYYKCSHAKRKKGCDKKPVKKDWIEDAVIHYIMKIVMDDELIDHIADAILNILAQENSKLPQLNARLKEIETGIQNMLNAIQQGILTPSTKERLEALEQEREEIKVAIYSEELQKPKITKEHIAFWISKFRDTDLTDAASRKRLVESFVNALFVYDDKVVFTFNYKDGSKTATIDEINAELGSDLDGTSPPTKTHTNLVVRFLFIETTKGREPENLFSAFGGCLQPLALCTVCIVADTLCRCAIYSYSSLCRAAPVVFCLQTILYFSLRKQGKEFIIIKCKKLQGGNMMNDHKLNFEKSDLIKYTKIFEEYRKTLENSTENANDEIKLYVEYPREISDFQMIFFNSDLVDIEYDRTMNERGWYNEKNLSRDIGTMSKKEAGTCLTAIFRGERFCAGLINEYVKNGIIVEILKHLSETH